MDKDKAILVDMEEEVNVLAMEELKLVNLDNISLNFSESMNLYGRSTTLVELEGMLLGLAPQDAAGVCYLPQTPERAVDSILCSTSIDN